MACLSYGEYISVMFWLYAHIKRVKGLFLFRVVSVCVCSSLFVFSIDVLTLFSSSECKGFEDNWKKRNIENTTSFKIPLTAGAVLQIRCVGEYEKLSRPDAVTCFEDITFYGLNDVICCSKYAITSSFWKPNNKRYLVVLLVHSTIFVLVITL